MRNYRHVYFIYNLARDQSVYDMRLLSQQKIPYLLLLPLFYLPIQQYGQDTAFYNHLSDSLTALGKQNALISYFEKESKKHPNSYEVQYQLARAYYTDDKYAQTITLGNAAITLNEKCDKCYSLIFFANVAEKKYPAALSAIDKAISIAPKHTDYLKYRAGLNLNTGKKWDAESDINKAVELEPRNADLYYTRAQMHLQNEMLLSAVTDLEKAVHLKPDLNPAIESLAILYGQLDQLDKLHQLIDNSLQVQPQEVLFYIMRSGIYAEKKEFTKAQTDIDKALIINPEYYYAYYSKGFLAYLMEDMDAACTHYQKASELLKVQKGDESLSQTLQKNMQNFCDPNLPSYYYQRGVAYYNLKKMDEAIAIYDEGLKKYPTNAMMLSFKANALSIQKKHDESIAYNKKAILHFSNYKDEVDRSINFQGHAQEEKFQYTQIALADVYKEIAIAYASTSQFKNALIYIDSALQLYPQMNGRQAQTKGLISFSYFQMTKVKILIENQSFQNAEKLLDEIIKVEPYNTEAVIYKTIAIVSAEIGKPERIRIQSVGIRQQTYELFSWQRTKPQAQKYNEQVFKNAILSCDEVIRKQPDYAFAYYIRGQIKWLIDQKDYCYDLIKAAQLEKTLATEIIESCRQ